MLRLPPIIAGSMLQPSILALRCWSIQAAHVCLLTPSQSVVASVVQLPYYNAFANRLWTGLWSGLLLVAGLLATLVFSENHHHDDLGFKETLTWVRAGRLLNDHHVRSNLESALLPVTLADVSSIFHPLLLLRHVMQ